MANISRFEIFGPSSSLLRMGDVMEQETPHVHVYCRPVSENERVWVLLYEDQNTAVQSSRCVTCILSETVGKIDIELADIGKQDGFRGTQGTDDIPVYDQILDFILDFSKQFGLTVQRKEKSE